MKDIQIILSGLATTTRDSFKKQVTDHHGVAPIVIVGLRK
jgi:hypothetical protein